MSILRTQILVSRHHPLIKEISLEKQLIPGLVQEKYKTSPYHLQFSSVAQSCPTLCDPMNRGMPGLPVHYQLPESTQTHVLSWWCHPAISSSVVPFSSCLQSFPASGPFQMSPFFGIRWPKSIVSALASVLAKNTHDWSPLEWTGWISLQSKGLSRVFSNNSLVFSFLYISTLTSIHDYWKNHSFD